MSDAADFPASYQHPTEVERLRAEVERLRTFVQKVARLSDFNTSALAAHLADEAAKLLSTINAPLAGEES